MPEGPPDFSRFPVYQDLMVYVVGHHRFRDLTQRLSEDDSLDLPIVGDRARAFFAEYGIYLPDEAEVSISRDSPAKAKICLLWWCLTHSTD